MMRKIIYFNWFYDPSKPNFKRLTNVLNYSFKKHNSNIELIEEQLEFPKKFDREKKDLKFQYLENIYKTNKWNEFFQSLDYGDEILFLDADIFIQNDISEIFNYLNNYDIILTSREYSKLDFNAGVVLFKVTQNTKKFFNEWSELISNFYYDIKNCEYTKLLSKTYFGAGQTTLSIMINKEEYKNLIGKIPCHIWNNCQTDRHLFSNETKIIHVKSKLREYILDNKIYYKNKNKNMIKKIGNLWFQYENEMIDANPEKYFYLNKNIINNYEIQQKKHRIKPKVRKLRKYW